jgi:hypothetical protein
VAVFPTFFRFFAASVWKSLGKMKKTEKSSRRGFGGMVE